ncbi:hypothetical protein [Orlajensenia leifsoniae]|uniref:Uncharacterized protein n=1 Tax=Orlajensenia leifsoniae TaxID=2561933 RepID=A0A4Y9R8G5_9MICO|nr:hypothetical protein [Leifsonia flava]TFV99675.1 hypothetical protein E4M00_00250 [Leifsonia flava]
MSNLKPGVPQIMTCVSETCGAHAQGHAISPIRERAANATPSKWRDAFVAHVDADGWIAVDLFDTGERLWAWHHDDLTASVSIGQPVALHAVYDVLSVGSARLSVLVTAA